MNFNTINIETQRLFLTGFTPKDMAYIFENLRKDEIKNLLGHRNENDYQQEEYKYKNGYASYNRSFILFLLTEKGTKQIIGRCGLHNWNAEHHRAEIGYVMSDDQYKRKGYMSEAVRAIIEYGFHHLNLHRIEALVGSNNIPSLNIIKNNNFSREGVLREHYFVNNQFEDSIVFSILYNEYMNNKIDNTTNR